MEPIHRFIQLYRRMRLVIYRRLLRRTGQLSAADAFAADIIYLLEQPTLTQFAGEMGISQPSASYRVNELAQKGVVERSSLRGTAGNAGCGWGRNTAKKRWTPPAALRR